MTVPQPVQCVGHESTVSTVQFDTSGQLIATCSADATARVWNWRDEGQQAQQTLTGHEAGVSDICWHPREPYVATASDDLTLGIWDVGTGKRLRTFKGHTHYVFCCKFHQLGSVLVRTLM